MTGYFSQYISKFHIHIWGIVWQYGYRHLLGYTPSKPSITQFQWAYYVHALEFIYLNMHIAPILDTYEPLPKWSPYVFLVSGIMPINSSQIPYSTATDSGTSNYPRLTKKKRLLHVASRPSIMTIPDIYTLLLLTYTLVYYDSNNRSVSYSVANWPTETNPSTWWNLFSRVT